MTGRQTPAHAPSTAAGQPAAAGVTDGADDQPASSPRVSVSPWRRKKQPVRQTHTLPKRTTSTTAMRPPTPRAHTRAQLPADQTDALPAQAPVQHAQAATRTAPQQQPLEHPSAHPVPDDFVIQDSQDACESPPPPPRRKPQTTAPSPVHQHQQQKQYSSRGRGSTTRGTGALQSRVSNVQAGVSKAGVGRQRHVQLMPPPPPKPMPTASLALQTHHDDQVKLWPLQANS